MKKQQTLSMFLSLGIALVLVVLVSFKLGKQSNIPVKNASVANKQAMPSPTELAVRESQGIAARFNLTKEAQAEVAQLYEAYEEIYLPFTQKAMEAEKAGTEIDDGERANYMLSLDQQRLVLVEGMKSMLTPEQFQDWAQKDPRYKLMYNIKIIPKKE